MTVPEEIGRVRLLVVRAQGLIGSVSVEYRTIDGTARSAGKTPADYLVCAVIYDFYFYIELVFVFTTQLSYGHLKGL